MLQRRHGQGRWPSSAIDCECIVSECTVLRHASLVMFMASQERCLHGRRTKAHPVCDEDEDTAGGGPGCHERSKRCVTVH